MAAEAALPAMEPDAWDESDRLPEFSRLAVTPPTERPAAADQNGSAAAEVQAASSTTDSRPASRAATADGSTAGPFVDSSIRDALCSSTNRPTVCNFELEVENFLGQPDQQQLVFAPNLTPYQRMLAHKTSQYYGLETSTAEGGDFAGRIIALRTPSSARPRPTRLSDLKLADGRTSDGSVPGADAPKLLVRRPSSGGPLAAQAPSDGTASATNSEAGGARSVQEREQEYHKARARIFGGNGTAAAGGGVSPEQQPPHQQGVEGANSSRRPSSGGGAVPNGGTAQQHNLGKKAVLRNRQAELQDPDFRRAHGRYAPRYDQGFGDRPGEQPAQYAVPPYGSQFPELPGRVYPGVPTGYGFQAPPPMHSRRNSGGMPDMAAAAAAYHAAAAAQQQQHHHQQAAAQAAQQRGAAAAAGGWGAPGMPGAFRPPPPGPYGSPLHPPPQHQHQQQQFLHPMQQHSPGGPRPPGGPQFVGYPGPAPHGMQLPADGHLPHHQQQQQYMPAGMQAVPVAGLSPGMQYQYLQPAAMPGQQVLPNGMPQYQGGHAVQYAALPGYGFVPPRPGGEGLPGGMAAAGYPGLHYPPGVYPMQLAMPHHMQQHQMAMAAGGHLSAPPSPQRVPPRGGVGRGSRRSSASSVGRHQRSSSLPQSPQVTPPQPPPLQAPPTPPAAQPAAPAPPAASPPSLPEAPQPDAPLQFGDGVPPISLPSSAGASPLEAFAPQKE